MDKLTGAHGLLCLSFQAEGIKRRESTLSSKPAGAQQGGAAGGDPQDRADESPLVHTTNMALDRELAELVKLAVLSPLPNERAIAYVRYASRAV